MTLGRSTMWRSIVLVTLTALAYCSSLTGPWVFDDFPAIRNNPAVRSLDPAQHFVPGNNRPVLTYSFALNYQLSGWNTLGYHITNVLVHLAAGFVLWRLLVRLLKQKRLLGDDPAVESIAWVTAALWLVHPLQTESVSYIVQRGESLMGLLFLATIYFVVLTRGTRWRWLGYLAAIVTTWLGMGCKEVMIVVPLVLALIDRMVWSRAWRVVIRRRWPLYLGLIVALAAHTTRVTPHVRGETVSAGFGQQGHSWLEHLYSEPLALGLYLWQTICPWPLCFDWNLTPVTTFACAALPGVAVLTVLGWALWAGHHGRVAALPWLCFFVILAPTSSFVPVLDIAAEHRMYLPLAALLPALVLCGYRGLTHMCQSSSDWKYARCGVTVGWVMLTSYTCWHNTIYRNEQTLWQSVVDRRPENYRAHSNLATALLEGGDTAGAVQHLRQAMQFVQPRDRALVEYNLGHALLQHDEPAEALRVLDSLSHREPNAAQVHELRGDALMALGQMHAALAAYRRAIELAQHASRVQLKLAQAHLELRQAPPALEALRQADVLQPNTPQVIAVLAEAQELAGDTIAADASLLRLKTLEPSNDQRQLAEVRRALARREVSVETIETLRSLVARYPQDAVVLALLASALSRQGDESQLVPVLKRLVELAPRTPARLAQLAAELRQVHGAESPWVVEMERLRDALESAAAVGHASRVP